MPVPWCRGTVLSPHPVREQQREQEVQQLKEKQHAEERAKKPVLCLQLSVIRQADPPLAEVEEVSVRIQAHWGLTLQSYVQKQAVRLQSASAGLEEFSILWGLEQCACSIYFKNPFECFWP